MCGRYTLRRVDIASLGLDIAAQPGFDEFTERPRFNIAPSQDVPVIRLNKEGAPAIGLVNWGLIPHWTKEPPKSRPINARCETAASSGMFRQAFARRRCIIPADGFYEWRKLEDGTKQPTFIHFTDDRVFGLAGLWERWRPSDDAVPVDTFTILTTRPNALMAPIHDRMPVILHRPDWRRWLDRETPLPAATELMQPHPEDGMEAVAVSKLVNSPRNDQPQCVQALG
jgi:putative SOS response-associated peptidase YedK